MQKALEGTKSEQSRIAGGLDFAVSSVMSVIMLVSLLGDKPK